MCKEKKPPQAQDFVSQELIEQCLAGDKSAWNALLGRIEPVARAVLRRFRSSTQDVNVDELVQETCIKVFRKLWQYDPENCNFKGWICKIAANEALQFFRSQGRKKNSAVHDTDGTILPAVPGREPDPALAAEKQEQRERVRRALARLPDNLREVLKLKGIEELSHVEVANVLQRPMGTVRSWYYEGLKMLRNELADEMSG